MLVQNLKHSLLIIFRFLNIISLDAPLVVLFWTEIICTEFEVIIPFVYKFIFFFSAWLAYSADRFLESYSKKPDPVICDRHLFFFKSKKIFGLIWITIFVISIYAAVKNFSFLNLLFCFGLLFLVILNQLQSFFRLNKIELILPKNIRTSLFLSLTCFYLPFLFTKDYSIEILLSFLILGVLFYINCLKIKLWEETNKYFKPQKNKLFANKSLSVLFVLKNSILSLLLFYIIFFEKKMNLFLISILLTVLISVLLDKTRLQPETKRVFLDQLFWIVPLLILLKSWQ